MPTYDSSGREHVTIVIDNVKYFNYLDKSIRCNFADFEVRECLPRVRTLLKNSGVVNEFMEKYPTEGYYYKTAELRELFQGIRNIQQNENVFELVLSNKQDKSEELIFLKKVYESDLFGTAHKSKYPWPNSPLKRRWDILTTMMSDEKVVVSEAHRPWNIPLIMENLGNYYSGKTNLVELAALIQKPELLTAAAESNALGRMYAMCTGSFSLGNPGAPIVTHVWRVDNAVEALGRKIAIEYNLIMGYNGILAPSEYNMGCISWQEMEVPRVAHLGYLIKPKLNYFWIADKFNGSDVSIIDYYTRDFVTTETYPTMKEAILKDKENDV